MDQFSNRNRITTAGAAVVTGITLWGTGLSWARETAGAAVPESPAFSISPDVGAGGTVIHPDAAQGMFDPLPYREVEPNETRRPYFAGMR